MLAGWLDRASGNRVIVPAMLQRLRASASFYRLAEFVPDRK